MTSPQPNGRKSLYTRLTASVPLLVTVAVHVVLVAVAGYFFVSEQVIGKKKSFEASKASDNTVVQKQVEHRLQVARKGGGSASASPVSASRIFSTAANALQLPSMPDLPTNGASSLGAMGFGTGMGALGTGTGYNTGMGSGKGLGSGFMSLSFLGTTSQRASKIVFIVDVGANLLDVRKGGAEAFAIIRDQIMKLVSSIPASGEFNVVVYESDGSDRGGQLTPFALNLLPATSSNKTRFFEWMTPINPANAEKVGLASVPVKISWRPKALANAGLDETLQVPCWVRALRCALEMEPDTIYVIAGSPGWPTRQVSDQELAKRKRLSDEQNEALTRSGINLDAVKAAKQAALAKASAQLNEINVKLKAQGKSPYVVTNLDRMFQADFQESLKKAGFSIKLDPTGWTTKEGKEIRGSSYRDIDTAPYTEVVVHISQLQRALLKERAALNIFLFVGPNEEPKDAMENLGKASSRNGGKFQLLTTKRLKDLVANGEPKK